MKENKWNKINDMVFNELHKNLNNSVEELAEISLSITHKLRDMKR